jgi:hypothetical protein
MQHREFDERKALIRPDVNVKVMVGDSNLQAPQKRDVVDVTFDGEDMIIHIAGDGTW